jgi:ParB/RepB/Spo0J family partition protein
MERLAQYDVLPLPCGRIYYDSSFNCRGEFTLQSVEDLSKSIIEIGRLLSPVWVQPAADVAEMPEGYDWRLVAGHRRYKAATVYLKWPTIPATIFTGLTERQARLLNFTENLERKDLNPLEEALTIRSLFPAGTSAAAAARELKRDHSWVCKRLRILTVPEQVQQMIAARRVTLLDLEIICRKDTPEAQIKAAEALAASKRGRAKKADFGDGEKLLRSFRRRRNKSEINAVVAQMFELGIQVNQPLAPLVAAWCAGTVSDEELQAQMKNSEN